jgi:hypothetical protein
MVNPFFGAYVRMKHIEKDKECILLKAYLIRLLFGVMTMVIGYGVLYLLGWHKHSNAILFLFPIAVAGGWGAWYLYKTIMETKNKQKP